MPVRTTYPGVYIEEVPSGVRTITGVATSVAAFVGYTARGLDHRAKRVLSFADFERAFGGLASDSELSYAVAHFFDNGGTEAWVVRVPKNDADAAEITLEDDVDGAPKDALEITALSKGAWANNVIVDVDYSNVSDANSFNLTITDLETGAVETFLDVTIDDTKANYVVTVVNDEDNGSEMVKVSRPDITAGVPEETGTIGDDITIGDLKNDDEYGLEITATYAGGTIADVQITVIAQDDPLPGSVLGVCRMLEQKINLALGDEKVGAAVRCVPTSSGKGIRVLPNFDRELIPDGVDASLTFADHSGSPSDIRADIQLDAPTVNVGHYWVGKGRDALAQTGASLGGDGTVLPKTADLIGSEAAFTGIYALDKVDIFNILCIPDATRAKTSDPTALDSTNVDPNSIFDKAMSYCKKRRAFLIIDALPNVNDLDSAVDWISSDLTVKDKNGAAYFPRLRMPDPLNEYKLRSFAPCGVVAGLYARTDTNRGIWKAPAGTEARLVGVSAPVYKLTDAENGVLNPLALNCFRNFPVYGNVSWGARTLVGADELASEWKYIPVRRLALFLEESLFRGTKWVVFEPNDEPLWAQIRLNVGAFMHNLFRQGAFQGTTPRDAYFVKCDKTTTTQNDINLGRVNIVVGFAPLKPAEFVVIKIQQMTGEVEA